MNKSEAHELTSHEEELEVWDWETGFPCGIGVSRGEAHEKGVPHEAVHLWILKPSEGSGAIIFQKRSPDKKSYPGFLDITVGGHVPFRYRGSGVVKEAREEIGIDVDESALFHLGFFRYEETRHRALHREFQRVYLLADSRDLESYSFNDGEVTALCQVELSDFENFYRMGGSLRARCFDGTETKEIVLNRESFHPELLADSMRDYMTVVLAAAADMLSEINTKQGRREG